MAFPDLGWMQQWAQRVNEDAEFRLASRGFAADLLLEFGPRRYLVSVGDGALRAIEPAPTVDRAWRFAVRAPLEVWERYLRPQPPPLHHHIFAMWVRVPEFRLEGDVLAMAQNVRAVTRMFELLRAVGDGDGCG